MWVLPRASSCRLGPSGFVPQPHKELCLVLLLPKIVFLGSSRCWQHHHTPGTCQPARMRLWVTGCADMALCAAPMCQTGTARGLLYIPFPGQTGTAKGSLSFPLLVGWILRSWAGQGILTRGLSRSQPESCWHSRREHRHWWVGGSSLNRNCSQTGPIINRSLSPFQYCTDCWEESLAALRALPGLPSGMTAPL